MNELVAPIVLFTYKRLDKLKDTIFYLEQNALSKFSDLYIFSDGPKNINDENAILRVREYLQTIVGFKTVSVFESPINKGLASSIIDGVTQVFKDTDYVIVLEDDLKCSVNFLDYMNHGLSRYRFEKSVFSISAYSFDLDVQQDEYDGYFLNRGWSWGWGTWKDRWERIDWNVTTYSSFIKDRSAQNRFAKGGSDLNMMLNKQMRGILDSWAIRWFYQQFLDNGLTLYPVQSKVTNEGFDQFATHTTGSNRRYRSALDKTSRDHFNFPNEVKIHALYQSKFQKKMSIKNRIISKLESLFRMKN